MLPNSRTGFVDSDIQMRVGGHDQLQQQKWSKDKRGKLSIGEVATNAYAFHSDG
jgi:hypothetical protein